VSEVAEKHFGFEGPREEFVERLIDGAPQGSITQRHHTDRQEEVMVDPQLSRHDCEHAGDDDDHGSMLNCDTVSQEVSSTLTSSRVVIYKAASQYHVRT